MAHNMKASVNILITEKTLSTLLCGLVPPPIGTEHVKAPSPLEDATGLGTMSQTIYLPGVEMPWT